MSNNSHSQIDPEKFRVLAENVCEIKDALVGNPEFGRKGLVKEVEELKEWRAGVTLRVAWICGAISSVGVLVQWVVKNKHLF